MKMHLPLKIVNCLAEEALLIDCSFLPVVGAWLVYFILFHLTMAHNVVNWDTEKYLIGEL